MNPLTQAALVTGGATLAGSYLGYKGQQDTNAANIASAREQMAFQARMSNTAYRRAMKDMRKAGLNPMLAYMRGGASSPAGAMPVLGNPMQYAAQGITQAGQSLAGSAKQIAETEKVENDLRQAIDLHKERWERLFATMGPENVMASVQAVLNGVNIKQVLTNAMPKTHINTIPALKSFVQAVRANRNWIASNVSGFVDIVNSYLPAKFHITPELIEKGIGE